MLIVKDATEDPRFAQNPLVLGDPNIRFYAGAPLIDGEGHVLGSICVIDQQPRPISSVQRTALQALARRIIAQMELRRISAEMAALLTHIKTLRGLLPICAHCKGIVVPNPQRTRARHSCAKCGHKYICDGCAFKASLPDYVHTPFAKVIDQHLGSPTKLILP